MRVIPQEHSNTAKWLHWLVAELIAVVFPLGLVMADMPRGELKGLMIDTHELLGVAVFVFAVVRLARRAIAGSPEPTGGSALERTIASAMHTALYILLLALPLIGWALVSAGGHQIELGPIALPALIGPNEELKEVLEELHELAAWFLVGLAVLHAAAAVKHHVFDHDDTLVRMLPWRRTAVSGQ